MLPEFLRLPPSSPEPGLPGQTPVTSPGQEKAPRPREHPASPATSPGSADSPPFCTSSTPTTPTPHAQEAESGGVQTVEGEHVADLMLTGEGDISSPSSTLLPPPPTLQDPAGLPTPGTAGRGSPAHL